MTLALIQVFNANIIIMQNKKNRGVCNCSVQCGKKNGKTNSKCLEISFMVFRNRKRINCRTL